MIKVELLSAAASEGLPVSMYAAAISGAAGPSELVSGQLERNASLAENCVERPSVKSEDRAFCVSLKATSISVSLSELSLDSISTLR